MKILNVILCLMMLAPAAVLRADDARFDLPGPTIDVSVTRKNTTLPIAQVPNLLPHDKLQVKLDVDPKQSNRLLLIVAFLRDTTDEPPDSWFTKIETWKRTPGQATTVEVPDGAQWAMMFVAPETGGDFETLRSAVQGTPGLFIRAGMSLNRSSLEQQRIEHYLAGMRAANLEDEKAIESRSGKLAATLALKPNTNCFKQPVDDQVDCLTQSSTPLLLDDGHGQTAADAISTGTPSDLINEAGQADGGLYSVYVGTLIDLVHLVGLLHTAQYRYIPAISFPQGPTLNLKLNAPPSFHNPKSVIVIALPPIRPARFPQVRLTNPEQGFCLANPSMTLPLFGTPLIFSTEFAHDLVLDFGPGAIPRILPLRPDAFDGGLVRLDSPLSNALQNSTKTSMGPEDVTAGDQSRLFVHATLRGRWGFETFDGPTLTFQRSPGGDWRLDRANTPISGQEDPTTLHGTGSACVRQMTIASDTGPSQPLRYTALAKGILQVDLPLKDKAPGDYSLVLQQYGSVSQSRIGLTVFGNSAEVQKALLDPTGAVLILTGQHLESVQSARIGNRPFLPQNHSVPGSLELESAAVGSTSSSTEVLVQLKDGRQLEIPITPEAPGTVLKLLSLETDLTSQVGEMDVVLGSQVDIPLHGTLHFVVQSMGAFPRSQAIQVATADGALHTMLSLNSPNLTLEDDHTVVGTLDLDKAFGESAFGELRLRAVPGDGSYGNWISLGKLVRRPHITAVRCTNLETPVCVIEGTDLFLATAFSSKATFENAVPVPIGFDGSTLVIPIKTSFRRETLFLRLRDDPYAMATIEIAPANPAGPARTRSQMEGLR